MELRRALAGAVVLFWTAGAAFGHGIPDRSAEAYRSPDGEARSVSVNPNDGSCWAANGNRVVHYAASGAIISRTDLWVPVSVSVNPTDGSCWVGDAGFTPDAPDDRTVVHLAADGSVLSAIGGFQYPVSVAVDPGDGSCWVADGVDAPWTSAFTGSLVRLSAEGAVLWRGLTSTIPRQVQVSATEGSCWVRTSTAVLHLSASGQQLSFHTYADATSLAVNPADGSCWVSWVHGAGSPVGLAHLGADGTELWQSEFADVTSQTAPLAVDTSDGSCRVGMVWAIWRFAADGTQLPAIDAPESTVPASLSVHPSDGSIWVASSGVLFHFASTGGKLWQNASDRLYGVPVASPSDGSCWTAAGDRLLHIGPDGEVLQHIDSAFHWPEMMLTISPYDGSVWLLGVGYLFQFTSEGDALQQFQPLLDGQPAVHVDMAIDASDGSFWLSFWPAAAAVARYSSDGEQLARSASETLTDPRGVAVDPADHSCWVADGDAGEVVHIGADGSELDRVRISPGGGATVSPEVVALDPTDGSCYVTYGSGLARVDAGSGHVSYFSIPAEALSVDPDTGACWVGGGNAVTLLAPDGTTLWREEGFSSFRGIWGSYELRRALPVSFEPARHGCWVFDAGNQQVVRIELRLPPYSDVPSDFWACDPIYLCWANGIVFGYEGGQYRPTGQVTRDQMAVYISRALAGGDEAVPEYAGAADFSDVGLDYWAAKYIYYIRDENVVTGYEDGTYQPTRVVTRDQMAVYVSRAVVTPTGDEGLAGYEPPDTPTFSDVSADFWAYRYVEYAQSQGIVSGYEDGTYQPDQAVTRDQMAVYIARAFALE